MSETWADKANQKDQWISFFTATLTGASSLPGSAPSLACFAAAIADKACELVEERFATQDKSISMTNESKYVVTYYGPDGSGSAIANPPAIHGERFTTVDDARDAIYVALGGKTFGTWDGLPEHGDIEAWHESGDEGCGGYAISEVREEQSLCA